VSALIEPTTLTQSLVAGLGPITLAAIAFSLRRSDDRCPWHWLLLFALGQGLREWLGALPAPWSTAGVMVAVRSVVSIAGFVALIEFARLGLERFSARTPGRWILAAIAVPIAVGTQQAYFVGSGVWTLLLSAIAGGSAAFLLWRAGAEEGPLVRRWMRLSGLLIGAYAILAGLGADLWTAGGAPGATTLAAWAVAGPLARELAGLGAAALLLVFALWSDSIGEHGVARWRGTLGIAGATGMLLVLVIGGLLRGPLETRMAHAGVPAAVPLAVCISAASFGLWVALLASWRAAATWATWTQRRSRNLLTSVTESIEGGLLAVDAEGKILYQNAGFGELWSIPAGFMQQGDVRILFGYLRDRLEEPEAFTALTERALRSIERVDESVRLRDGRVFRCLTNPLTGAGEGPGRIFGFREITEYTRSEAERHLRDGRRDRQIEALASLATRLALSVPGGRTLAPREVCELAAAALEVERASLWLREEEGGALQCAEFWERFRDTDEVTAAQRVADYADFFRTLPPERAAVIEDTRDDLRAREAWERHPSLRDITSLLQIPVELSGHVVGAISFAHVGVPRRWTADEQRFATSAAALVATVLERGQRLRMQEDLQRSLEFRKLLAETAACAVYQTDAAGRITEVNSSLCRMTGFIPEELIGQPVSVIGAGACGEECQILGEGPAEPVLRHPCWLTDRNGKRLDIVRSAAPLVDAAGNRHGTLVSFIDVSEAAEAQRQSEEALRMAQRAQSKTKSAHGRIETLEAELARLRTGLEGRERETAETREAVQALQAELQKTREEREAAQWASTSARRENETIRGERDATQTELETARRERDQARGEQARLQEAFEVARCDLADAREKTARIEAQVETARQQIRTPERELLRTNAELAALRAELATARETAEAARCQAESAYKELRAARTEAEGSRAEATALAKQMVALQAEADRLGVEAANAAARAVEAEKASARAAEAAAASARAIEKPAASPASRVPSGNKPIPLRRPAPAAAEKPAARPVAPAAIDYQALLASVGGDRDLAMRRLRAFQKGAPWMLSRLRQALVKQNALALVSAAESIRAAAADLAAHETVRQAEKLEELARAGDLPRLAGALQTLETEIQRVHAALNSLPRAA
jgi:PAS domain S-box-containing protein